MRSSGHGKLCLSAISTELDQLWLSLEVSQWLHDYQSIIIHKRSTITRRVTKEDTKLRGPEQEIPREKVSSDHRHLQFLDIVAPLPANYKHCDYDCKHKNNNSANTNSYFIEDSQWFNFLNTRHLRNENRAGRLLLQTPWSISHSDLSRTPMLMLLHPTRVGVFKERYQSETGRFGQRVYSNDKNSAIASKSGTGSIWSRKHSIFTLFNPLLLISPPFYGIAPWKGGHSISQPASDRSVDKAHDMPHPLKPKVCFSEA